MNSYLMIENKGVASRDLITVVGATTSRDRDDLIGCFGSGWKYSIAVLMREAIDVKVYTGLDGFVFGVDERRTKDVAGEDAFVREVVMKQVSGRSRRRYPLGFDVGFGEIDWTCPTMAIREFISNAADACKTQGLDYGGMNIKMVDESQVRAKEGYTRVFIQSNREIREYIDDIDDNFLIFDDNYSPGAVIIPKRASDDKRVRIYRKGVLVGKFPSESLFDYNIDDIPLKESRIIEQSAAESACGRALKYASPDVIAEFLRAVTDGRETWETVHVNRYNLRMNPWEFDYEVGKQAVENWREASKMVLTDKDVLCDSTSQVDPVSMKGYRPIVVSQDMLKIIQSYKVGKVATQVLDAFEVSGKIRSDLDDHHLAVCHWVWDELRGLGVANERPVPTFEAYDDIMNSGSNTFGYRDPNTGRIGISRDVLSAGKEFMFVKTVIEECAHHITRAQDCTRDLQDFAFRCMAKMFVERSKTSHPNRKPIPEPSDA